MTEWLTERDLLILAEIYNNRVMGASQIRRAYFGNMLYAYNRIKKLEKMGYLCGKPVLEGRRKLTEAYYVTDKGISCITVKNPRQSNKNRPNNQFQIKRQLAINEVLVRIIQLENKTGRFAEEQVWQWIEARETKEKFNMNRGDIISGCLVNKVTGSKYGVYVPIETQNIDSLLKRYHTEMCRHILIRDNIVLCSTPELFKAYRNMDTIGGSIRVLPFEQGINLIWNLLTDNEKIKSLYETEMHIPRDTITVDKSNLFASHRTEDCLLVELLTNDISRMCFIHKYYRASKELPLKILCWDTQADIIRSWNKLEGITLYPVKWNNNAFLEGVENEYRSGITYKKPKTENSQSKIPISLSLPDEMWSFLIEKCRNSDSLSLAQALTYIIKNTEEYQQYLQEINQ